jgi:hypothetical protein
VHTVTAANKVGKATCRVEIDILVSPQRPGVPEYEHIAREAAGRSLQQVQQVQQLRSPASSAAEHKTHCLLHVWRVAVGGHVSNRCKVSGSPPLTFKVKPELPEGLELDAATGTITGCPMLASPASACVSAYYVTVSNDAGESVGRIDIDVQLPPRAVIYWPPAHMNLKVSLRQQNSKQLRKLYVCTRPSI